MIRLCIASTLFVSAAISIAAEPVTKTLDLDPKTAKVEFLAIGRPSAIKVHGEGNFLEGRFTESHSKISGGAKFRLDSLSTGISKRDEHMKTKYLETAKYPEAELQLIDQPTNGSFPFTGALTLHGVKKNVTGSAVVTPRDGAYDTKAEFTVKLGDFGVEIPKFAGITVAEDVNVKVEFVARSK